MLSIFTEASTLLQHSQRLDSEIIYDRDFDYDYFGFKVGFNPHAIPLVCLSDCFKLTSTASYVFVTLSTPLDSQAFCTWLKCIHA